MRRATSLPLPTAAWMASQSVWAYGEMPNFLRENTAKRKTHVTQSSDPRVPPASASTSPQHSSPAATICARATSTLQRLTGTFNVTRNAIPHLMRSGKRVIIVMSSAAGRFGYPNRSPDANVKWGLIGFTKTLSMELGAYNVRANAILAGGVDGDRIQRVFPGRANATGKTVEEIKSIAMPNQRWRPAAQLTSIGYRSFGRLARRSDSASGTLPVRNSDGGSRAHEMRDTRRIALLKAKHGLAEIQVRMGDALQLAQLLEP